MTLVITLYETTGRRYHASNGQPGGNVTGNRAQVEKAAADWIREYLDAHPVEQPPGS